MDTSLALVICHKSAIHLLQLCITKTLTYHNTPCNTPSRSLLELFFGSSLFYILHCYFMLSESLIVHNTIPVIPFISLFGLRRFLQRSGGRAMI